MIIATQPKKKKKETSNETKKDNGAWVKGTEETKKIKQTWDDGYQFGDISKTILGVGKIAGGAAKDAAVNVGKGFVSTLEGTVDAGRYLLGSATKKSAEIQADIWDLFGNESYANSLRKAGRDVYNYEKKNAMYDVTANLLGEKNDLFKENWSKKVDEQSILGNKADSVFQGIGNVGAFVGAGYLTGGSNAATFLNSFSSAYGNTRTEAYKNGADDKTANRAAWISGLSEGISEQFFSGIPGLASAGWGDALSGRVSKSVANFFGSKAGRIALTLFDGIGEGTEEILSNMFNAIGTDVMHYIDNNYTYDMKGKSGNVLKDTLNAAFSQDSLDSFVSAMLTSVLTGGGKQLTQGIATNQASNQVAKQGNITKTQATELLNQIAEKRANLELDDDANFKEKTEAIDNQKKMLSNEIKQAIKEGQQVDLNELLNQTPNSRQEMQFKFNQDELNNVKSDEQKRVANEMARFNNEKDVHDTYKSINIAQGINDTVQYHPTTTEGLYEMGIIDKDANGNYTLNGEKWIPRGLTRFGNQIYVNLDAGTKSATQAMFHEMFESFKANSSEQYNQFKQMVTDIVGQDTINNEIDDYIEMYKKAYADEWQNMDQEKIKQSVTDEIINDKFGELAEDQNFINRIADNRNVLEKLIDSIKDMIKYVKGTPQEREFIKLQRNLEKEFAKRYKETDFSGNKGETAYSLNKDSQGRTLSKKQQEYFKDSKVVDENGNLKVLYHGTPNNNFYVFENQKVGTGAGLLGGTQKGFYFTDSKLSAEGYAAVKGINDNMGVKEVYLNMKNPLIVDTTTEEGKQTIRDAFGLRKNAKITTYYIDNYINKKLYNDAYGIVSEERRNDFFNSTGYDGVININDIGDNEYIVFNSNQIKNIDNTTPTTNPDIRYSLTKDNTGRELSEGQQNFVKDNAKELFDNEGRVKTYYHTTTNEVEPFSVFNPVGTPGYKYGDIVVNFYTDNPVMSGSYADSDYAPYNYDSTEKAKYQYKGYISMKNPYVIDSENRSYGKANLKANESASKVLNILNNLSNETINELAQIKQEARDKSYNQERLAKEFEYLRNGFDKEQQVAIQIGEILDATEKYNLNEEAQERNNRLIEKILEKEGFTNEWDLDNLKYEYYQNDLGLDLSKYGLNKDKITLKDFVELENNIQNENKYTYEIFDDMLENHRNNKQIAEILDTTFDIKRDTRVINEETGNKQYGRISDLVYDAIDFDGNLNRKYLTKEGLDEHYVVDGFINQNTNDVIREVLEMNKNGSNYDGVIFKNLYDYGGATFDLDSEAGDVVVTFNSNQFKDYRNLNPTEDADIRYSMTSNENIDSKEIAPIGSTQQETTQAIQNELAPIREDLSNITEQMNNLSNQIETLQNGLETTPSEEIAPVNPYRERAVAQREANQAIDEIQKDDNYWQSLEQIANEEGMSALDDKSARKLSRNIGKELGLKQKQVKDLQNVINDAFNNGYSLVQIKEELYSRFGHDSVVMRNEEAIDAQQQIREHKIKVSPDIQKNITDYGYWKQQYYGKIKFSNEGSPVDVVYAQLSEQNPTMFPSDIWNETDQLLRIAEVADMSKKYSVDYEMDQATIDEAANYIHDTFNETLYANAIKSANDLEQNALQYNERTKDIPIKKRTRQEVREFLQSGMGITTEDLQAGNDIKSMQYQLTTPERVNEKVFGREVGRKINEQTVNFAKHQEAERTRFLNKERNEIKDLGIKARSKESALVQQYGEGLLDDVQLAQQVENVETQNKIKNAARVLRGKYDAYLDQINEVLTDMGYDPIPKRKDYMRHFQELTDKFSQAGIPFNRQDLNAENLPTDINGLTEFNTPGKNYFASAKQRKGFKTTYDAITGIDGYLEGASNLMYHTETIQRYRTLEKMIRDTYGQTHGLDEFNGDVSSEEAMQRVQDIENGKLSNYAAWIHEQGNAIAGKKGALDRGFERALGRRAYTLANTLKKQTGSNMTGFNVRSALTNFISSTIAAAKTNKMAMVHGTIDTIKNIFHDDGFINRSDFLTSRFGSDSLSQKTWQKLSNAGQIFMQGSDWFTSNLITRSKYYEGISKGMTDTQAMNYANDFAARVMGDRSKGATAEAFNSKTLGFLTQFQLETNNQWQYMIHDTKMEFQENLAKNGGLKASSTVLFQMGQLAAYSYLFNEMFEKLTGSRAAFDIADILKKLFGLDPDDEDKTFEERMKEAGSELVDALPFASLFGSGGRLPIGEMLTPFQTVYDYITGGTNKYGDQIKLKDVTKDLKETLPYYLLPTGYGQLKKTIQGLGMYNDENPIPGSYTDSGNLRFTADTDTGSVIKNALFGQWSGEEAKKYRESGYKTINAKDIPVMKDLGMSSSEFREFKTEMKEETTTTMDHEGVTYNLYFDKNGNRYWYDKSSRTVYDDKLNPTDLNVLSLEKANANELKYDYVSNLDIDENTKQKLFDELFSNTTTDKYGYKKYIDESNKTYWYDEDNDTLYNSKYSKVSKDSVKGLKEVTESKNMDNYKDYGSYAEFDYAYKNPGKYKTIKAIAGYDNYKKFDAELKTIRDNTKQDKKETIKYVNSLDLTIPQKAMFIKQYYPTFNDYNKEIVNYVSNLDVSYEDKVEILKSLKFKVDSNGNVKW